MVFSSVYLFFFFAALEYYLPGCFHIARHLAAESGTRFSLPVYSHLCWGYNSYFGGCVIILVFSGKCYFHRLLMI